LPFCGDALCVAAKCGLLLPRESGSGGYYWEDDGQATLTFVNRTVSTGVPIPPMTVELRLSGQTRA
jgi:hypothetical protein